MELATKRDTINRLRREILSLQHLHAPATIDLRNSLGKMNESFPNLTFPTGVMHEFLSSTIEENAASLGFISTLISMAIKTSGYIVWISTSRKIFPPALQQSGIEPGKIIFIQLHKPKDILWVIEETLKCEGVKAVVGEIKELDFTVSRRFQLAVEKSKVTGFILRHQPKFENITACVTRWKISPLPSELPDSMPGVGFPRWKVNLLKVRNGTPAIWEVEWKTKRLRYIDKIIAISTDHKQTG